MDKKTALSTIPEFREKWKNYLKGIKDLKKSKGWYICSDYCLDDKTKCNSTITFTIMPEIDIEIVQNHIKQHIPKDLKKTSSIHDKTIEYLKDFPFYFSISFIVKNIEETFDINEYKKDVLKTIKVLGENKHYKNNPICKKLNTLTAYLNQKRRNTNLIKNLSIIHQIMYHVSCFLISKTNAHKVFWISDRGPEATFCDGIIFDLVYIDLNDYAKKHVSDFTFGVAREHNNTFEFDEMIRIPDFIGGVISSIDIEKLEAEKTKHFELLVNSIASNNKIIIFLSDFKQIPPLLKTITIVKKTPENNIHKHMQE